MSIGTRLREERERLGRSQTDFGASVGVKKQTQISWEKGTSSPPVAALEVWMREGVDVVYVLTGRRSGDAIAKPSHPEIDVKIAELDRLLAFPQMRARQEGLSVEEIMEGARLALEQIALSSHATSVQQAAADDIIRMHFDDKAASKRRSKRFAATMLRHQTVGRDMDHLIDSIEADLPRDVRAALTQLVLDYDIEVRDLIPLIDYVVRWVDSKEPPHDATTEMVDRHP